MFCQQCGKEIKDGAKFCGECGWAVPAAPVQNVQPVVLPSAMPPNQNTGFVQTIAADEKYCSSCGSVIKKIAEICPKCGVKQETNSVAAIKAKEYDRVAISSFFIGILAIVYVILSFFLIERTEFLPLSFVCSVFGLFMYIYKGRKSVKRGIAMAGLIVCIVGAVAAISLLAIFFIREFN